MSQRAISRPVLIVEDEFLIAMHIESLLEDLGFIHVRWAADLEAAERVLEDELPAFAVLDINIGPHLVYPFAQRLREREIPFLFSSGGSCPPPEWAQYPFVSKPLDLHALDAAIQALERPAHARERPRTLGDVLYGEARSAPPEHDWLTLNRLIAARNQTALHQLFERAHAPVLALIACFIRDRQNAEEVCLEVFHDVWRRAPEYAGETGSVLGWIMRLTRERLTARAGFERPILPGPPQAPRRGAPLMHSDWPDTKGLQAALARHVGGVQGGNAMTSAAATWHQPPWQAVAPGIECKLFAADGDKHVVSMMVRLAPGASYPPHTHAGVEELHLLEGELWIDERKLIPGDYNYGAPGASDDRVWSETGCTCVLITSTQDELR